MTWTIEARHWVLLIFIASALYQHFRGRVRFGITRALVDFTVLIAPVNALMYLFSKIPAGAFIDRKYFPEMNLLNENWQVIRDEMVALVREGDVKAADGYTDIGYNSFFRSGWQRFHLVWYGKEMPSAIQKCPKTLALLKSIPSVKAAMFASLPPGATLNVHRDPYAGSLRYQLGLVTPNDDLCFIEVDGQRYSWRDGQSVIFDETYVHYAANQTNQQRYVLFCDVERPVWTSVVRWLNRLFGRIVLSQAASQNNQSEGLGFLNHIFEFLYKIRLFGKRLKTYNRTLYYAVKWSLILAILWLIFR